MGSIRVRNETGKLFFDFKFQNVRCREQTSLDDTKSNRVQLQKVIDKIDAEILLGQFVYRNYFPNSNFADKFEQMETRRRQLTCDSTPLFKDFAWEWYEEMEVGWRNSHKATVKRMLGDRIMAYFGEREVSHITKADILKFRAST